MKRYKSAKILGEGSPGKIVQCQSFCNFKVESKSLGEKFFLMGFLVDLIVITNAFLLKKCIRLN
jgi:hypothetical protein